GRPPHNRHHGLPPQRPPPRRQQSCSVAMAARQIPMRGSWDLIPAAVDAWKFILLTPLRLAAAVSSSHIEGTACGKEDRLHARTGSWAGRAGNCVVNAQDAWAAGAGSGTGTDRGNTPAGRRRRARHVATDPRCNLRAEANSTDDGTRAHLDAGWRG